MSTPKSPTESNLTRQAGDPAFLFKRHLSFGWWMLLLFLSMGILLEILHGFKIGYYLKTSNETRRLMWTLAHAHGTLLALINIGFAFTTRHLPDWATRPRVIASAALRGATLLMPAGFFLGGLVIHAGDPGIGILLLPVGALLLAVSVFLTARGVGTLRLSISGTEAGHTTSFKRRGG